jgi:hypothetical protein
MAPRKRRPRGHIEELPSHRFRAIVYAGTDPLTGRTRQIKQTAATYAEAEVALTKLLRQVDERKHPKSGIMVREAIQQWLDVAELGVTTCEQYDDLIRLYIGPTWATCRLRRSTPSCSSASTRGSDGQPHGVAEVRSMVASTVGLTPEDLALRIPSGRQS